MDFGATEFLAALTSFVRNQLPRPSPILPGPIDRFDIYKQVCISIPSNPYLSSKPRRSRIRATPAIPAKGRKAAVPAHFDTALIEQGNDTSGKTVIYKNYQNLTSTW